jgi:hypothetical protein
MQSSLKSLTNKASLQKTSLDSAAMSTQDEVFVV